MCSDRKLRYLFGSSNNALLPFVSSVTFRNSTCCLSTRSQAVPPLAHCLGAAVCIPTQLQILGILRKESLGTPVRLRPDQTSRRKRSEDGKTSGVKTPARGPSSSRGTSRASRQCPHTFAGVDHSYWVRRPPDRKGQTPIGPGDRQTEKGKVCAPGMKHLHDLVVQT